MPRVAWGATLESGLRGTRIARMILGKFGLLQNTMLVALCLCKGFPGLYNDFARQRAQKVHRFVPRGYG